MQLTADRFRALARSSPWRWRTIRLTARWSDRAWTARAWVRRPDGLRVEDVDGTLRQAGVHDPAGSSALLSRGRRSPAVSTPWIGDVEVVRDGDGLIAQRPQGLFDHDPMYRDYLWVAMLDPAELADGEGVPAAPPVTIEHLEELDHHGRGAWEAVVRPTEVYDPRCACCALLHSEITDAIAARMSPDTLQRGPDFRYPDAHRVRLDLETSICVLVEAIGGTAAGVKAEFALEGVDAPMPDDLFGAQTDGRRRPPRRLR